MTYPSPREVEHAVYWLERRVQDSCDHLYPRWSLHDREALRTLFAYVALTTTQAQRASATAQGRGARR